MENNTLTKIAVGAAALGTIAGGIAIDGNFDEHLNGQPVDAIVYEQTRDAIYQKVNLDIPLSINEYALLVEILDQENNKKKPFLQDAAEYENLQPNIKNFIYQTKK